MPEPVQTAFVTAALAAHPRVLADLLRATRAAHAQYQQAKRDSTPLEAYLWLVAANKLREVAIETDPTHNDSAWQQDTRLKFRNNELIQFYRQQIARHG